jgi:hypothetical protein
MRSQVSSWSEGSKRKGLALAAAVLAVVVANRANAQLPMNPSTQFDITGFIEDAKLDGVGVGALQGGTIKVSGHTIVIPSNTIVILPASAYTWAELFTSAPAPYGPTQSGLATSDIPAPLTTFEAHVTGNRVLGGPAGADLYIAGLVVIHQASLSSGAGFINFMDYTAGEMRVGGVIGDSTTGARVRLNDPVGRFGRKMGPTDPTPSPDPRFAVDDANPTITAGTGFPMCFPRAAPSGILGAPETDPLCPQANRPGSNIIQMQDPATGLSPNPKLQVPFQVGDYVTYAGTLVKDCAMVGCAAGNGPTAGPWPTVAQGGAAATYVAAHTIVDNVAVFTAPGTDPAYVSIEVSLIGTGGLTVIGAGEAVIRTRFEGMTTDPTRNVRIYGVDIDGNTGLTTDRLWGYIGVDPGPPTGAVKGRWRFRPPCTSTPTTFTDKSCAMGPLGVFIPPTREVRAVIAGQETQVAALNANDLTKTAANGLFYGQYHAPIGEYIFPENLPGTPIVENNFNTIPFLTQGGYVSNLGTMVKQLNPWPSNVIPTPACVAPVANPGGPYTVAANGTITLNGSATGTQVSLNWTVASGGGTITNPTLGAATYSAVGATSPVTLTLTATSGCGATSSVASATVTVNAVGTPTVNHVTPIAVTSGFGGTVTIPLSGLSPGGLGLTFAATQTGTPALLNFKVVNPTPLSTTGSITFNVPSLPLGQILPSVINLNITASNGTNTSATEFTTVTINPQADTVIITDVTYRTSKQRLVVTATSSVVSPNVILKLDPYTTLTGLTFDPSNLGNTFTNNGNGLYTLTLVGAPQPSTAANAITVRSNLGGVATHNVNNVRQ